MGCNAPDIKIGSYASRKEGQLCPHKSSIKEMFGFIIPEISQGVGFFGVQLLPAAEDAEAAAALRELEKALTSYQDAEAEVAQGGLEKALKG